MRYCKLIFILGLMFLYSCNNEKTVIRFDTNDVIQDQFLGHGVQWSAYPHADSEEAEWGKLMTDEKWHRIFQRLDYMKPSIVRVIDQANWRYLKGFDKSGNPIIDFQSEEVRSLEKLLTYCQEKDINVLFGEWGCPYKVHDTDEGYSHIFTGANDPGWIDLITEYLEYLVLEKGYTCIKYYNLINEPNGYWASNKGSFEEWSEGVALLHSKLEKKGLSEYIHIAGPDAVAHYDNPESEYTGKGWVEASVDQLDEYIGLYDIHAYTSFSSVKTGEFRDYYSPLAELVSETGKAIIFGELGFDRNSNENQEKAKADPYACEDSQMAVYEFSYGIDMANAVIQLMNAGFSGAIAWSLDDAMHTLGDEGDPTQLKRWGMWNILGNELCADPSDENIRPWYYAWSLLCNCFPEGSKLIRTDILDKNQENSIRAAAALMEDGFSLAIVNNSESETIAEFSAPTGKDLYKKIYTREGFTGSENPPDMFEEKIPSGNKKIKVSLPANSLTLVSSIKH